MRGRIFLLWILLPLLTSFFWKSKKMEVDEAQIEITNDIDTDLYYDHLIVQAKRYMDNHMYKMGVSLYQELSDVIERGTYPKAKNNCNLVDNIHYRLAEAHYLSSDYEGCLALTQSLRQQNSLAYTESLYLRGLCLKLMGKNKEALDFLLAYLESPIPPPHISYALFHIGSFYYEADQIEQAKSYFEAVLSEVKDSSSEENSLVNNVSYYLAWCYMKLGDRMTNEPLPVYKKAETLFTKLQQTTQRGSEARLALAHVYQRIGLSHFHRGAEDPIHSLHHFEEAAQSFERGSLLLDPENKQIACRMLKLAAKSYIFGNEYHKSLSILEKLLENFEEESEEREVTLYLRGLLGSTLLVNEAVSFEDGDISVSPHFQIVENSFKVLIDTFPRGQYIAEAIYALATFYFKTGYYERAYRFFAQLATEHPLSPRAAEGYFWAAESALYLNQDPSCFRQKLFTNYPSSELAAEAYFRHCQEMLKLVSRTIEVYPNNIEEMEHMLKEMIDVWSDDKNVVTIRLTSQDPYPSIFEECEYRLMQCLLKQQREEEVCHLLDHMVEHYRRAHKEEGQYYVKVWEQKGKMALRSNEFDTAVVCFDTALAHQVNSEEQKMALWMLLSQAYRGQKQYNLAMRLLSRVINTDFSSPMRMEAMFQRSEIYEAQGRPELAFRQLEALAKKGGVWGKQAEAKMDQLRKQTHVH